MTPAPSSVANPELDDVNTMRDAIKCKIDLQQCDSGVPNNNIVTINYKNDAKYDQNLEFMRRSALNPSIYDIFACEEFSVPHFNSKRVWEFPLGFSAHFCATGNGIGKFRTRFCARIAPVSELARKGLQILDDILDIQTVHSASSTTGGGENPRTGEVVATSLSISVVNLSSNDLVIKKGERFAQIFLQSIAPIDFVAS
ncbi:MAG: hypothetical protein MHMPM18_000363 [Marteilia pararefringens]